MFGIELLRWLSHVCVYKRLTSKLFIDRVIHSLMSKQKLNQTVDGVGEGK